jgi:5'-methylthioinosine phosphorylase
LPTVRSAQAELEAACRRRLAAGMFRGGRALMLALIGGTGLAELPGLERLRSHAVETPYGAPSTTVEEGRWQGESILFLHRHGGREGPIPPHRVNYRANLWALQHLGARRIIAVNAVGGIASQHRPGRLVVPDQLIDYTWGREHSFDDGSSGSLLHVDFTDPYDPSLRKVLLEAARQADVPCDDGAVLAVVQGPRLETAAEVRRLARDGCDLVGMTGMPEAALARELAIPYAAICMVVNAAAGLGEGEITLQDIARVLAGEVALVTRVLDAAMPLLRV